MPPKETNAPQSHTTATLATRLGLSRWTVSRVINGHPGVKHETVKKVRNAMQELGYEPNAFARSLRGGRTGIIGICFQELESPILARKASLLQAVFREKGYQAIIELTNGHLEREANALRQFLAMRAEGVVLVGSSLSEEDVIPSSESEDSMPIVWVDPEHPIKGETIRLDRAHSIKLAIDHLHELSHRRVASLGIDPENPYGALRWSALIKHSAKLGMDFQSDTCAYYESGCRNHNYDYGRRLATKMLESHKNPPTAIVALNDRVAIGAINVLEDNNYRVPDDISVIGYDNLEIAAHFRPSLTTVDQRADKIMALAAKKLLGRIDGNVDSKPERQVKPKLIVRGSTGIRKF